MRNTVRRANAIYALVVAFFVGLGFLVYGLVVDGDTWAASRVNNHLYTKRQLSTAGTIYDRDGKMLVETKDGKRVYNDSLEVRKSTLHVVGDAQGFINTSIQKVYRSELIGYSFWNGIYGTVSKGRGSDITLTLDADVCTEAYRALGYNKGTVGVYNYKTGEVICMVSTPTYDPMNKPSDIDTDKTGKYDGAYLNRFISGVFTPGSTFKVVTAISAIDNNLPDLYKRQFECKGYYEIAGEKVICNSYHGKLSFQKALNRSCNSTFSNIANQLGPGKLTETVRALGFGKKISIGKITTYRSTFDLSDAKKIQVGWAGIGQHTTLINPCQMMVLMGAIANGGTAVNPYLIQKLSGKPSLFASEKGKTCENVTLSLSTAGQMKNLLRSNVTDYYKSKFSSSLQMAGKTGTAEVSNGRPHAWFTGFSVREDLPYAVVVVVQNGGSGSSVAIPIANRVMKAVESAVK